MRKCKLIKLDVEPCVFNGESYIRGFLTFEIIVFGLFKYTKIVFHDVTMFEDFKEHIDYWNKLIKDKSEIPFRIIKNKAIFD